MQNRVSYKLTKDMLTIRLQRIGRRNNPSYRVIVIDSKIAARKGRPVELLGQYDPIRKNTVLKKERIIHWIGQGAQVSETMHNILIVNGVIDGVKKNVLPKKHPIIKQNEDAQKDDSTNDEESAEELEDNNSKINTNDKEIEGEDSSSANDGNDSVGSNEETAEELEDNNSKINTNDKEIEGEDSSSANDGNDSVGSNEETDKKSEEKITISDPSKGG